MEQHFVTFLSPGTFCAEDTTLPVNSWDPDEAVNKARTVVERHAARPYGFYFTTRSRRADELDSRVTAKSHMYYIGGKVRALAEVEAENDPAEAILRENMRCNGWDRIITNDNSWRWTQPLKPEDVVLNVKL